MRRWVSGAILVSACGPGVGAGEGSESSGPHAEGSGTSVGEGPTTDGTSGGNADTGGSPTGCVDGGAEPGGTVLWTVEGETTRGRAAAAVGDHDVAVVGSDEPELGQFDVRTTVLDGAGAPVWTDGYAGAQGLGDHALGVAVDGAGFIHVLLSETILSVAGETSATSDARLVVLRYAPDGTKVWRWERERAPIMPWMQYSPSGTIAVVGERVLVLERAWNEPTRLIELDVHGNMVSELDVEVSGEPRIDHDAIGRDGGVLSGGSLGQGGTRAAWVARSGRDGVLQWSATFGSRDDRLLAVVAGDVGESYVVWATYLPAATEHRLRRYESDGAEAWTELLPVLNVQGGVAGALHCDGSILLTGGLFAEAGPDLDWEMRSDLWVARYGPGGELGWSATVEFGPPFSFGGGHAIASTRDGAVIVLGSHLDASGSGYAPWIGAFAG